MGRQVSSSSKSRCCLPRRPARTLTRRLHHVWGGPSIAKNHSTNERNEKSRNTEIVVEEVRLHVTYASRHVRVRDARPASTSHNFSYLRHQTPTSFVFQESGQTVADSVAVPEANTQPRRLPVSTQTQTHHSSKGSSFAWGPPGSTVLLRCHAISTICSLRQMSMSSFVRKCRFAVCRNLQEFAALQEFVSSCEKMSSNVCRTNRIMSGMSWTPPMAVYTHTCSGSTPRVSSSGKFQSFPHLLECGKKAHHPREENRSTPSQWKIAV